MHDVELAGLHLLRAAAAAARIDELDSKAVGGEEAARLRHPERQHGVDRVRHADLERRQRLLGGGREGGKQANRKHEGDAS